MYAFSAYHLKFKISIKLELKKKNFLVQTMQSTYLKLQNFLNQTEFWCLQSVLAMLIKTSLRYKKIFFYCLYWYDA